MIPAILGALAILDAAFAGFRAAAGRDARIFKRAYYQRAVLLGAGAGVCLVAVIGAVTALALFVTDRPALLYAMLVAVGARMLHVLLVYAFLVLQAMAVYFSAKQEIRSLATVAILGPFTLLRPWVIVAATAWGLTWPVTALAASLTIAASASVILLGWGLDRWYGRIQRRALGARRQALVEA